MPNEVTSFFGDLGNLIDSDFSLDISIAYAFFRIEQGQRQTLYCGARKLHRTESTLTWKAIDEHDMTRAGFRELFKTIYGYAISNPAKSHSTDAEKVRDDIMHGRSPTEAKKREAITKALHYAKEMNSHIQTKSGFKPFAGDLRGIVGRLESLDKSTTRWILKGMNFTFG